MRDDVILVLPRKEAQALYELAGMLELTHVPADALDVEAADAAMEKLAAVLVRSASELAPALPQRDPLWYSQGEQDANNAMDIEQCLDACDDALATTYEVCHDVLVAMLTAEGSEPGNDESTDPGERARNLAAWRDGWAAYAARSVIDSRQRQREADR